MDEQVPPPVAPLETLLDFHPQAAAAGYGWFQNVCAEILRATPQFNDVEAVGVSGEAQEGLDIRAVYEQRERWGFQCKQERDFGPGRVSEAINAVPVDPTWQATQYRILLSRVATDGARTRARDSRGWDILDAADLSRIVRALPVDVGVDIVRRYFGDYWLERFFGIDRARTFVVPERFYRPFLNHEILLHNDRPLRGRDEALQQLTAWQDGTDRCLIVSGRLGLGVSKILYEFVAHAPGVVIMPLAGRVIDAEALNEVPVGSVLIVVDDEDVDRLRPLLNHVAHDPEKRVIVGCQPERVQAFADVLFHAGLPAMQVKYIRLTGLTREATIALARDVVLELSDDDVEGIIMSASDTPLATIVTARLAAAPTTEAAVAIYNEATARHRQVIDGRIAADLPREHVRTILRLVAALGPVRADSPTLLFGTARFGLNDAEARRTISAIRAVGGFAEFGEKIAISPTVVRDGILIDACTTGNAADPFVGQLCEAFTFEERLFANLASANDAAQATGRPAFLDGVWQRTLREVMEMDNARRRSFVKAIRGVAPYKPADVLRVCRNLHHNPPGDDRQEFEAFGRVRADHVDDEISTVLGDILQKRAEYAEQIVPLLWDIGATDGRPLNAHPNAAVRVLRDAVDFDGATPAARRAIIEAVSRLLDRPNLNERHHSPIDVLEPALALQGHNSRSRGDHLYMQTFGLAIARVADVRDRALGLIIDALHGASDRRALVAMKLAARLLAAVAPYSDAAEDIERLRAEQARVLDAFERVAASAPKLRQVALHDELIRFSRRTDAVGSRIDQIIESIPIDDGAQLFRAVAPALAQNWRIDRNLDGSGFTDHRQQLDAERLAVARRLVSDMPTAEALRDALEVPASAVDAAGINPFLQPLLAAIAVEDLDRAIDLAHASLDDTLAPHVSASLAAVIVPALVQRPEVGRRLVNVAQSGSVRMRCVGAIALDAPLQSSDVESTEVQHRLLATIRAINDEVAAVRNSVRLGAARFVTAVPSLGSTLIEAFAGEDGEVVDWVYGALSESDSGDIVVDAASYERLARRLVGIKRLEFHEVRFLAGGVADHAPVVFEVIEARLRRPYESEVQALPHDPTLKPLADAIVKNHQVARAVAMASRALGDGVLHQYDAEWLFGELWIADPDQVRDAVFERAKQAGPDEMRTLPSLLGRAPLGRLVADIDLLVAIVEGAYRCGYDVGEATGASLEASLVHRPHVRTGRTNTEELVVLEGALQATLQRVQPGSETEALFARLLQRTGQEMTWERRLDDEAFGPP